MSLRFVPARASHKETLLAFLQDEASASEGRSLQSSKLARGVDGMLCGNVHRVWLVQEDETFIGSMSVNREWSDWQGAWYWWIHSFYLRPDCRGRGLGRSMVDFLVETAHTESAAELRLYVHKENAAAKRAYEKAGFSPSPYEFYVHSGSQEGHGIRRPSLALRILGERFAVVRLQADEALPPWATRGQLSSITRTQNELSVVCEESALPADAAFEGVETGFRAFEVAGPLDFAETGILSSLATSIAQQGIALFAISTFDTDYLLVREVALAQAKAALVAAGHRVQH